MYLRNQTRIQMDRHARIYGTDKIGVGTCPLPDSESCNARAQCRAHTGFRGVKLDHLTPLKLNVLRPEATKDRRGSTRPDSTFLQSGAHTRFEITIRQTGILDEKCDIEIENFETFCNFLIEIRR